MATSFLILHNHTVTVLGHRRAGGEQALSDLTLWYLERVVCQCDHHVIFTHLWLTMLVRGVWGGGHPLENVGHFT